MSQQGIRPAPVRRSVEVKVAQARAFEAFTGDIGRWWPKTHTISKGKLKRVVLEPREGGRWYGEDEDGATTQWGKVLAFEPPRRLLLAWQIDGTMRHNPDFVTEIEVLFQAIDGGTRVELEHRDLERFCADTGTKLPSGFASPNGWGLILSLYAAAAESRAG